MQKETTTLGTENYLLSNWLLRSGVTGWRGLKDHFCKNTKPDALSCVHQREEGGDYSTSSTIVPSRLVLGATRWSLERRVKASVPDPTSIPSGCPTECLYVPSHLRQSVLKWGHSSRLACHPGVTRTAFLVGQRYWWPTMSSDIRAFVALCPVCGSVKTPRTPPAGLLQPLPVPSRPWSHIAMVYPVLGVLDYWVFGRIFCDIWAAVDVLCCTASIMSLCVISIDRYIGVRYPLQYPMIVTKRRALLAMLGVWILSFVISIGPLLGWKEPPSQDDTVCLITEEPFYALFSSLGSFYIPLGVILAMYCRVYVVAKRTTRNLEAGMMKDRAENSNELTLRIHVRNQQIQELCTQEGGGASSGRSALTVKLLKFSREKKAAKTLGVVVGMFILCWLPFFLVLPIGSFSSSLRPPETLFKVIFWLGYFNSCLNPIIYPCYSREFKQAFIRILRCRWKSRRRPGWQAYCNYRGPQGSNNSSFLNGSQQTLSSVSASPRCSTSKLHPPPWPFSQRQALPGRGGLSLQSQRAHEAGTRRMNSLSLSS